MKLEIDFSKLNEAVYIKRKEHNLNQEELKDILGISHGAVSNIESKNNISLVVLLKCAIWLEVKPETLYTFHRVLSNE